jgi:hypothetical protein
MTPSGAGATVIFRYSRFLATNPFSRPNGTACDCTRFNIGVRPPGWRYTGEVDLQERGAFGRGLETSPSFGTEFRDGTEGNPSAATTAIWPSFWTRLLRRWKPWFQASPGLSRNLPILKRNRRATNAPTAFVLRPVLFVEEARVSFVEEARVSQRPQKRITIRNMRFSDLLTMVALAIVPLTCLWVGAQLWLRKRPVRRAYAGVQGTVLILGAVVFCYGVYLLVYRDVLPAT